MENKDDKKNCFARIDENSCNALTDKKCDNCKFYCNRENVKDNPYYAYSYKNKELHKQHVKNHKITADQIIFE